MERENEYTPDRVSPPGETIWGLMELMGIHREVVEQAFGLTTEGFFMLIEGRLKLRELDAERLEKLFGTPKEFWMERERLYRESLEETK